VSELKAYLIFESGPLSGQRFSVTPAGLTIGRNPVQANIAIQDPEISRVHARVFISPENQVWAENSSVNGTFVNDSRVEKSSLRPGDTVRLGLNPANTFSLVIDDSSRPQYPPRRGHTGGGPIHDCAGRGCRDGHARRAVSDHRRSLCREEYTAGVFHNNDGPHRRANPPRSSRRRPRPCAAGDCA
jgi:hypothetical protein